MSQESVVEYYCRRAAEYDEIYERPERQQDLASLRQALRTLLKGEHVLELACGTGYWTSVIAPVLASILATDASDEMLALARAKGLSSSRVRFQLADAFNPSSIDGHFTAGFAAFWWSHVPRERLRAFLDSFHARLGVGTRIVFIDNRYVEGSSTPIVRSDAHGNTYQIRQLRDGTRHEVLKNFPTAPELRASLATCADVEVTELTYYWCLSYTVGDGRSESTLKCNIEPQGT